MRVAWRVKHWLEPLLYRTLVMMTFANPIDGIPPFTMETFDRIARTKPASFLRDSVRNVIVESIEIEQIKTILATCTGVENLWILPADRRRITSPLLAPHGISLRHLYCDFRRLCGAVIVFESFSQPFFSHITHLELFHGLPDNGDPAKWDGITALAHLTHLAVGTTPNIFPSCPHLLEGCKSLRALVILEPPSHNLPILPLNSFACDPRFVVKPFKNYVEDWQRGVLTGRDFWARADEFIAKRISGEIARSVFFLGEELNDPDDSEDPDGSDDSDNSDHSDEDST
ncbi:hypothetical protein DFH09DRAFT_481409 [Mycena vulgaris]|nr:hypothetical protein DFH09DRAFT_481409 [Mycena vulgaris]